MSVSTKVQGNQFISSYKRMWPFIKPFWPIALLSLVVSVPIGALDATIALFLKPYTDTVLVQKEVAASWYIPFLIVSFALVQGILVFVGNYLNIWVGGKLTLSVREKLYSKLLKFPPAYFDKENSGNIIFRYGTDAELACAGLLTNLKNLVTRVCSSIALIGVLFYNSWHLAIMAVIVLIVALAPLASVKRLIKGIIAKNVVSISAINTSYNETFAGNRTITAYNLQKYQEGRFKGHLEAVFDLSIRLVRRTGWLSPFMHFAVSIGLGLAVAMGGWLIVSGTITAGNFVSFLAALLMLYTPLKTLGNTMVSIQQSFLAIERISDLLDVEPKIVDKEDAITLTGVQSRIQFDKVGFSYKEDKKTLSDINLDIRVGETIAIVGNSGGGKSTLVSLLPRFYDVESGSIKIDGVDIRDMTLESLHANISVVFQDNFLFSGSIRENIMLGDENATEEMLDQAVESACLDEFVKSLPLGLDTETGERGVLLSGGQKQRVAIARAFLKNSPILVLDEATSALDNKSEKIVQQAIDNLMKDKTVFVIAHRLSTIKNANRIVVIHEGKHVECGTHAELINIKDGFYKHLYEMQFHTDAKKELSV